jgi:hypothetical protein
MMLRTSCSFRESDMQQLTLKLNIPEKAKIALSAQKEQITKTAFNIETYSCAVQLDEGDIKLWINLLCYKENFNFLMALAPSGRSLVYRFATIMRWLTDSEPSDYVFSLKIQDAAKKKYGEVLPLPAPQICAACGRSEPSYVMGGRVLSSCLSCAKHSRGTHPLIYFKYVISNQMYVSLQEFLWRLALALEAKQKASLDKQRSL